MKHSDKPRCVHVCRNGEPCLNAQYENGFCKTHIKFEERRADMDIIDKFKEAKSGEVISHNGLSFLMLK